MNITIHVSNGESFRFAQPDKETALKVLDGFQPNRLFTRPQILVHGSFSVSGFSSKEVEFIEFETDLEPGWTNRQRMESLQVLAKEDFDEALMKLTRRLEKGLSTEDESAFHGLVDFRFLSGRELYLRAAFEKLGSIDDRHRLQSFFESEGFAARMSRGGWTVINTRAIVRYTIQPGPPTAPLNAWVAARQGDSFGSRLSMQQVDKRSLEDVEP